MEQVSDLAPPQASEEELDILGAMMLSARAAAVAVKEGLRGSHFYSARNRVVFNAAIKAYLERRPTDPTSIAADLEGEPGITPDFLRRVLTRDVAPGQVPYRAQRVIELAERRNQWEAAHAVISATRAGDDEALALAMGKMQTSVRLEVRDHDAQAASRDFAAHLRAEEPIKTFQLPWKELMDASPGGFLRHHFVSIIGWSGYGKSILLDQLITEFSRQGYRCAVFMTEMDRRERIARYVAAGTGIPAAKLLLTNRLSDQERTRAARWIEENPLPFDPIEAEGWSAMRIREQAIVEGYDCIAVDTVNNIPHRRREDFEDEIRTLVSTSKLAGCLTMGVFQLNQQRRDGISDPPPSLRDIRETGLVEHLSDRILALHIENANGKQQDDGHLRLLKCRGGMQGGQADVMHRRGHFVFEDERMRKKRREAEKREKALEQLA